MKQSEDFVQEAEQFMRENTSAGQFYVLYTDLTAFHTINHIYGIGAGDALLWDMEGFLAGYPHIRLVRRVYADLFLCLCFIGEGITISEFMAGYDKDVAAFLKEQRRSCPACSLKAACGICRVVNKDIVYAIDGATIARKVSKKQMAVKAVLYSRQMREQTAVRHETERGIYEALKDNRFCFYLQPKVDLTTGEVVGAEALARRLGEDGEVIYPDTFLETMEASGAVVELDRIICRQVCIFLSERIKKNLPVVCTSVNLSRLHIQNPAAADEFHAIATAYEVPSELLEFELTETILLEEFTGAKQLIDQLRGYGYRVSIDDFGSGYAGINIWQELNFDCLKLDRKFLSNSGTLKQRNEALVPNIINIAQRLHVQVLCEGVETEEQCLYLMQLGCTVVQGFYFSKPVPPAQLCRICEQQENKYPLPPSLYSIKEEAQQKEPKGAPGQRTFRIRLKSYLFVIAFCALFMGSCIAGVLIVSRNVACREFIRMVKETLNAYTAGQRENTLAEIDGIVSTLESLGVLIQENDDPNFIDTYLTTLNEDSAEVKYMFYSKKDYEKHASDGTLSKSDQEIAERLKRGETVVTDIIFSKRLGSIYCVGVGVPVMRNGEFIGAVRGTINAESLISTELYDPAQGGITAVFVTDSDSMILPVRADGAEGVGERLLDRLEGCGIREKELDELRAAFAKDETITCSIRAGVFDGSPYYLSMTDLKYNGWHLVVCMKADKASEHFQYIVRNTSGSIIILFIALFLASAVLMLFVRKMQQKFSMDERRYLLLERFSDTVLFDYDCRSDTIRFTSNTARLLRVHEMTNRGFLKQLDQFYIYAGDREDVRKMLTGQAGEDAGKARVRLMRSDTEEYFWCMAQYQYLYEKGRLISVIGKITDIDEYMRHEDYLLRMSETDGLTGLLNKAAAEKQTIEQLKNADKGVLFVLDVDGFKLINDRYGHAAGDLALRYLGECMRKTFHPEDILGRIGGDELMIFSKEFDSCEAAQKTAELLAKQVEACAEDGVPPMAVSIGVACFSSGARSFQELFQEADQAMYASKQKKKQQA